MSSIFRRPDDYRTKQSPIFLLLAVASATSGTSANAVTATGTLNGSGALAGTCAIALTAEVTPLGGNLSGSAAGASAGTATLTATGGIAGTCAIVMDGSATPSGAVAYPIAHRQPKRSWSPPAYDFATYQNKILIMSLPEQAGISGQCDIVWTPTATLRAAGAMAGSSTNTFGGAGLLLGAGQLAGAAAIVLTPEGDLTDGATGVITGSADIALTGSGSMLGAGSLLGSAAAVFDATSVLGSEVQLSGVSAITFSASGVLRSDVVTIDTPRSRTVLVHNRRRR